MKKRSHPFQDNYDKYSNNSVYTNCSLPSPPYSADDCESSGDENTNESKTKDRQASDRFVVRSTPIVDNSNASTFSSNIKWDKEKFLSSVDSREKLGNLPSFPTSLPDHLAKVYPRLFGNITDSSSSSKCKNLKSKSKIKALKYEENKLKLRCNVCENWVKPDDLATHLYFGSIKCQKCNFLISSCLNFRNLKYNYQETGKSCPHDNFMWIDDPVANLKRGLECDSEKTSRTALEMYLKPLESLWEEMPWHSAIDRCKKYIKATNSKETNYEDEMSPNCPERRRKRLKPQSHKKKKGSVVDIINLPKDGNYFVVKEAIEVCPKCYTELDIMSFNFSLETWLIDTICKECYLQIYFVLTPPDGSEPRIKILQT